PDATVAVVDEDDVLAYLILRDRCVAARALPRERLRRRFSLRRRDSARRERSQKEGQLGGVGDRQGLESGTRAEAASDLLPERHRARARVPGGERDERHVIAQTLRADAGAVDVHGLDGPCKRRGER